MEAFLSSLSSNCESVRQNQGVNRKDFIQFYNIILVTFVYKLLDFCNIFYRMTAFFLFYQTAYGENSKEYMHPENEQQ